MENEEERKKLFSDLKAELYRRQLSNSENFDKSILSLSSAGLGFSLAFLRDFVPINKALYGWLLYGSWFFFTLTIVLTIFSFIISQIGIKKQLDISERYYLEEEDGAFYEKNYLVSITDWFNIFSGMFFIVAIIFTTVFVSINLERTSNMAEEKRVQKTSFAQDGAPIPTLQKIKKSGDLQKGAPIPSIQKVRPRPQQQQVPAKSETAKAGDK